MITRWRQQPLAVRFSLFLALLGLLGTALFVYELPALVSAKRLQLECDSLRHQAATLRRLQVGLTQLQGREQRLYNLLADRMNLAVDSSSSRAEVGHLLLGGAVSAEASTRVPIVNPVRGVISREFEPAARQLHTGVDIAGEEGDPVVAAANGTVLFAGWSTNYGNLVILMHSDGFVTRYVHLKTILANEGETVFQNQ